MDVKEEIVGRNEEFLMEKRPPSAMTICSPDSGLFSSVVPSENSLDAVPPTPKTQLNTLLAQTANLMAVNEQLRKEIAENEHIHSLQMRALTTLPPSAQQLSSAHLHQHMPPLDPRRRGERRMQKPESYKTVICQAWLESKTCTFAENCRFAHGEEELRPSIIEPRQNNKYKTKLCDKYTTTGLCPYGKRCLFIHPDHGPNAYIRADKLYEVSQRHALADLRDQMENQIMNGGRSTGAPTPSVSSVNLPGNLASQSMDMLARPSTPVESSKNITVPLGPTPVSTRGPRYEMPVRNPLSATDDAANRPPSSWPLEPSSFFSLDNANVTGRPVSPFESMLIGAAATAGVLPFTMTGKHSTPGGVSGYASGGSTPYQDVESSPFSPASAAAALLGGHSSLPLLSNASNLDPSLFQHREEAFSPLPGFDQLAEDMAKHLELW